MTTRGMSEKKILIVDDEPAIRSLLHCALRAPGVSLFEADCAAKALALAREAGPFELVVTDVTMPVVDGVELARQLLDQGQARSFLFISGYCDVPPEQLARFEFARFLAKPFAIPEFLRTVRALMGRAETGAAALRAPQSRRALRRPEQPIEAIRRLRRKSSLFAGDARRII